MSDISKHPLLGMAYNLGLAIEKCGASEELTNASVLASDLMRGIESLVDELSASQAREREAVERAESLAKNQAHIQERIQAALGNGADEQAWEPGEHWLMAACRVISAHTVKPSPEPPTPLFALTIPNNLTGWKERFDFTAEALVRMAAMEREGKIQGRIAQDKLELRSALAAARKALEDLASAVLRKNADGKPMHSRQGLNNIARAALNGDSHDPVL